MKNKLEGFTTGRILALLLVAAMILTLGLTAAASADDGEDEEIAVIEIAEPAEEATADFEEIAVLDEETLIKAAEEAEATVEEDKLKFGILEEEHQEAEEDNDTHRVAPVDKVLEKYYSQLAMLTDEQKNEVALIWSDPEHIFKPTKDVVADYAPIGIDAEIAFIISVANASACIDFVAQHTENEYVDQFVATFEQFCVQLENLFDEADPDMLYDNMIALAEETFSALGCIAYQEYIECGASSIVSSVSEYADMHGAKDCKVFFGAVIEELT